MIVFDVDGTLTDGGIFIGNDGEIMKKFDVKDGYAIHSLMPRYSMIPVIITGRKSKIVEIRAKELGIQHIHQGITDKKQKMLEIAEANDIKLSEIGYVGDDINDIECMRIVGYPACPSDAVEEVKKICKYVCSHKGGRGAVREFIEKAIEINNHNKKMN